MYKTGATIVLLLILVAGILFYLQKTGKIQLMPGTKENSELLGEWIEVNGYDKKNPKMIKLKGNSFYYEEDGVKKHCAYKVEKGESYSLSLENAKTIQFSKEDGPWYGELVYHTQEVNGRKIRVLTSFMYEMDGRGLMVSMEFVSKDDFDLVTADFTSDLYEKLNNRMETPTSIE